MTAYGDSLTKFLWRKILQSLNFSYIYFLSVNFENLIIEFHVSYILNIYMCVCVKFYSNRMLFTIWSINFFYTYF